MSEKEDFWRVLADGLREVEDFIARMPKSAVGADVQDRIAALRKLLIEHREPRFALVGRRGSGKSSLINAILGEPRAAVGHETATTGRGEWYRYVAEAGALAILDTRGLQEGSKPTSADEAEDARTSVIAELRKTCPDAVLFLVKAKEVDAAIDSDLSEVLAVLRDAQRIHGVTIPLLGVVTSCDELEPKNVRLHAPEGEEPGDLEEKLARVKAVERHLSEKIRERPLLKDRLIAVIGVSSYQSFRADGRRRADERWQIGELVSKLLDEVPKEARVVLVRVSQIKHLQRSLANTVTRLIAGVCAGVAVIPLPIADIALITPLQISLVSTVAYISGRKVSLAAAGEFLVAMGANVGVGFAMRELARALVKLIPVAGSAVSSVVAYATTVGLGTAAAAYFLDRASRKEASRVFAAARDEATPRAEPG
jgi:uncharacterized protein